MSKSAVANRARSFISAIRLFYKQDSLEIYGGIVATVVLTLGHKSMLFGGFIP